MTEREKMISGAWYDPSDAELSAARNRAAQLLHRLNVEHILLDEEYRQTLHELSPRCEGMIRPPFHCDYGFNIEIGADSFVNFGSVWLDLAPIRVGRNVFIGPNVQLLTAEHPMSAEERRTGKERGRQITIGDDCWLGGGVIICPNVKIGRGCVIGAGAVVTRDIPEDSVAVGNPARVIRKIDRLP